MRQCSHGMCDRKINVNGYHLCVVVWWYHLVILRCSFRRCLKARKRISGYSAEVLKNTYGICPNRNAVPSRRAGPSSNKHTTSVKGQIHTKCLMKHQKINSLLLQAMCWSVWLSHMRKLALPCKQRSMCFLLP